MLTDEDSVLQPIPEHIDIAVLLGRLNSKLGDKEKALISFNSALLLSKKLGDKRIQVNCLEKIGKHFYILENHTSQI